MQRVTAELTYEARQICAGRRRGGLSAGAGRAGLSRDIFMGIGSSDSFLDDLAAARVSRDCGARAKRLTPDLTACGECRRHRGCAQGTGRRPDRSWQRSPGRAVCLRYRAAHHAHGQIVALETLGRSVSSVPCPPTRLSPSRRRCPSAACRRAAGRDAIMRPAAGFAGGLLERVGGEFAVARELTRARREGMDLSVALFEIGPLSDDIELEQSIAQASDTLLKTIRQSDLPIRWSGREFVVVLPGLSGAVARAVAERVRAALQAAAHEGVAVAGIVTKLEGDESCGDVVSRVRARARIIRGGAHNRIVEMN